MPNVFFTTYNLSDNSISIFFLYKTLTDFPSYLYILKCLEMSDATVNIVLLLNYKGIFENKQNKQEAFRERRHLHVCDI